MPATLHRKKLIHLCEIATPSGGRVDREAGIIYGVKVLGRTSLNDHGVPGAKSTEYTDAALAEAARRYEGAKVNCDHPPRGSRSQERSSLSRCGWLENARVEADGVYADLHILTEHKLAGPLLEAAEKNPKLFALSHNAWGRGQVKGGVYVVTEVPEVKSVDIVADGGTVTSLFESEQPTKKRGRAVARKRTVRQVLESLLDKKDRPRLKLLREMGYGDEEDQKLMEQPVDGEDMVEPPMEAPAPASATLEDSLSAAVVAVLNDGSMDKAMKRKKILGILNLLDEPAEAETAPTEEGADEPDADDEDKQMEEGMPGDDISPEKARKILHDGTVNGKPLTDAQRKMFGAAAREGRTVHAHDAELTAIREELDALKREKSCRELMESERITLSPAQFEALQLLPEKKRKTYLQECRASTSKPRTQALREGRASAPAVNGATDLKSFVGRLTARPSAWN